MKSIILTKVMKGKPAFKDLVGLKPVKVDQFTKDFAKSLHKNSSLVEHETTIEVCTNAAFYRFTNFSGKYIMRVNVTKDKTEWYKIS